MAITRTRKAIATGAAAVGVVLGAAGITAAATNSDSSSTSADAPDASDGQQDSSYTSSITAPEGAKLDGLATITADQASSVAVSATGGTAGEVELENENGNVVYGVEITAPDGKQLDVKVDAGNASVLDQEADHDREKADSGNGGKDTETSDSSEREG
jgi:uncharacterized membrane protein YkoI